MKLNVNIEYRTSWGESIDLCLSGKRYPMSYADNGIWTIGISKISLKKGAEYSYEVMRDGQTVRKEWKSHVILLPEGQAPKTLTINDRWNDRPEDAPFYSTAFTKAIFGREVPANRTKAGKSEGANLIFQVSAANIRPGEVLALAASSAELGQWTRVIPFDETNYPVWTLALDVTESFEYKFIVADSDTDFEKELSGFSFPIIVKPTDRSGSRNIMKLESLEGVLEAVNAACESSFEKKAIVEEFLVGKEYSMETISYNGKHTYLATTKKFTTGAPNFIETGHIQPCDLSDEIIEKAKEIVFSALDALHIENSAGHSEFKVDENGNIRIIEIGARMGGDCIGSDLVYLSTGNDFVKIPSVA